MFKNMKRLISLVLPVVAITTTSCGNATKTISYEQMRRFVSETYDDHAIDTIPVTYFANLNKAQADVTINYTTPDGGADSSDIAFGFNGIHLSIKDKYAYMLSSTLLDNIEQYYCDFAGLAVSVKQEPPIQMLYQLTGNNCSKINFVANEKIVGAFLIKLLQFFGATLDAVSSVSGFIPMGNDVDPSELTDPMVKNVYMAVMAIAEALGNVPLVGTYAAFVPTVIFGLMNYTSFAVSDSSKSNGEYFNAYLTTDNYGMLNKLDFNFKSSFDISGLIWYKQYDSNKPEEGDHPSTSRPYHFSMSGSFDFDFDISSEIA